MELKNNYEAFRMGLWLIVTAPTEEQSAKARELAIPFMELLSNDEIERAKSEVEATIELTQGML